MNAEYAPSVGRAASQAPALRAHAAHEAAAEQAHDVDLVRALAEHDAAALPRVELLGTARAIEEVGEIERGDHAHAAVASPLSISARARRIGASKLWLWPTTRCVPGGARGVDHRLALGERERHRLFDEHVLAARAASIAWRAWSWCGVAM